MTTPARCSQCHGPLIGGELAFLTCGHCGGRHLKPSPAPKPTPRRRPIRDVITDAVEELLAGQSRRHQ